MIQHVSTNNMRHGSIGALHQTLGVQQDVRSEIICMSQHRIGPLSKQSYNNQMRLSDGVMGTRSPTFRREH